VGTRPVEDRARVLKVKCVGSGRALLSLAVVALVTAGCAPMGSVENSSASQAALDFDRSLSDPAHACALLAPGTLSELQQSFGRCDKALPDEHLPVGTKVVDVDVYGKDAIVRLDKDVVFLARFDAGWRVTAAGCTPRQNRPFNCTIKGQ
jgi:hypothetical protein